MGSNHLGYECKQRRDLQTEPWGTPTSTVWEDVEDLAKETEKEELMTEKFFLATEPPHLFMSQGLYTCSLWLSLLSDVLYVLFFII